jgi:hypothetical protein
MNMHGTQETFADDYIWLLESRQHTGQEPDNYRGSSSGFSGEDNQWRSANIYIKFKDQSKSITKWAYTPTDPNNPIFAKRRYGFYETVAYIWPYDATLIGTIVKKTITLAWPQGDQTREIDVSYENGIPITIVSYVALNTYVSDDTNFNYSDQLAITDGEGGGTTRNYCLNTQIPNQWLTINNAFSTPPANGESLPVAPWPVILDNSNPPSGIVRESAFLKNVSVTDGSHVWGSMSNWWYKNGTGTTSADHMFLDNNTGGGKNRYAWIVTDAKVYMLPHYWYGGVSGNYYKMYGVGPGYVPAYFDPAWDVGGFCFLIHAANANYIAGISDNFVACALNSATDDNSFVWYFVPA